MGRGGLGYQPVAHPPISSLIDSTPTIRSLVGTWTNRLECPPKFYSHVPANSYSMALCLAYGIHTGYIICLHYICMVEKTLPFYHPVANNTGIWCPTVKIILDKRIYNLVLKIRYAVKSIVRDPDDPCCLSGIINLTAPAFLSLHTGPGTQCDAYYIISFLFKKIGGYRTIDSS